MTLAQALARNEAMKADTALSDRIDTITATALFALLTGLAGYVLATLTIWSM